MSWALLALAGLFEIAWAVGLKLSNGLTRPGPAVLTVAAMMVSLWLLALALRTLPLGTAYAAWTGIGTAGAFLAGIVLFGESAAALRVASVMLILAGLVGLKLSS
ncbi:MAG: multidrug efflux SMR transporter [Xanthomonadales bacterium]|nr:multidrug efflux SMR transporter [Xanthomonadales bacterium]